MFDMAATTISSRLLQRVCTKREASTSALVDISRPFAFYMLELSKILPIHLERTIPGAPSRTNILESSVYTRSCIQFAFSCLTVTLR